MSTELENPNQPPADEAPVESEGIKNLRAALDDPETPEETKQEIRDSLAKLETPKYDVANRYAHNAGITVNRTPAGRYDHNRTAQEAK